MADSTERDHWAGFLADRNDADRKWLIENYMPLVEGVMRSFRNVRRQDRDDLIGAGYIGLVESIDKWNPALMPWLEFARFRIRAAMVDHIRKAGRVPKSVRSAARKLEQAEEELTGQFGGRPPTDEELTAHLGLENVDELAAERSKLLGTEWSVNSLDLLPEEGSGTWGEAIPDPAASVEAAVAERERDAVLASILDRLPARHKDVMVRRFLKGQSQKAIAAHYCIHESRVSQIIDVALEMARRLAYERPLEVSR
jgi:RNA polymerase sigma factor (sigma-70 family)